MDSVEKLTSDGLSDMQSVRYLEAANKFDSALSKLWPCHRDTPLEHWIEIHRGHALVRAGLLQRPALEYGKKPHDLLQKSFDAFYKCVKTLQALDLRKILNFFDRSLLFSGRLGLAWIYFFRGNMVDAEMHIEKAAKLSKRLDRKHFRADRDIDTNFLRIALCREIGTLPDDFEHLCLQFGHKLSKYEVDKIHVGALDNEASNLAGNLEQSVALANYCYKSSTENYDLTNDTFESVDFMHHFEAGCVGDTWFLVGAYQEARVAYECAYGSESVLVRAAASVGLGNVLMRLSVVKMEAFASVGNGVTAKRSGTEADESSSGFASAEMKYEEALKIYNDLGFKVGQIIVLCNLGNLYHKRKELKEAFNRFTTALKYCSGEMDRSSAALHLHLKLAELYLDMEKWVEAFDSIVKAENLPTSNKLARTWVEHLYGSYYVEKAMVTESKAEQFSNLAEARNHLCNAVSVSAEIQQSAGTYTSLRTYTIFEQQKETYALLLWCLALQLDAGTNVTSVAEILVWCERGRSRVSLSEMWNDLYHLPVIRKYISEVTDLDALQATAAKTFDTQPYEQSWKHLQVLLSRCKLPPATTVVEYALCADFGFLIFVLDVPEGEPKMLRVSFKDQELNGEKLDREKLTAVVNRTVSLLHRKPAGEADKEVEANLRFFYQLLIKPVEKWLINTQQIIVIPHEVLFKVPFHALIDGGEKYLIERYALSCAESIRSLVKCSLLWELHVFSRRRELDYHHDSVPSGKQTKQWLVIGINSHRQVGLQTLKFAEKEAAEIHKLLSEKFESTWTAPSQLLEGPKATKDRMMPSFKTADIIHLATHGIINAKYERGGVILAPGSEFIGGKVKGVVDFEPSRLTKESDETTTQSVHDRFVRSMRFQESERRESKRISEKVVLSAGEISRMNLKAQLVVLSACQSAEGVIFGEGVAGLGRALMQAGVPCTVLSLWPVSDKSTTKFMTEFYKELLTGRPVAEVMQAAMVTMINAKGKSSRERSYYVQDWAAFLAFGHPSVRVAEPAADVQVSPPHIAEPPASPSLCMQVSSPQQEPPEPPSQVSLPLLTAFGVLVSFAVLKVTAKVDAWTRNSVFVYPSLPTKPTSKSRVMSWGPEEKLVIFANLVFLLISSSLSPSDEPISRIPL